MRNDETKELIGIEKMACSAMNFTFENSQIITSKFLTDADGDTYPPSEFPENVRKFRGFVWREHERPLSKEDIFLKDTPIKKTIDEGISTNSDFKDEKPTKLSTKNDSSEKEKEKE